MTSSTGPRARSLTQRSRPPRDRVGRARTAPRRGPTSAAAAPATSVAVRATAGQGPIALPRGCERTKRAKAIASSATVARRPHDREGSAPAPGTPGEQDQAADRAHAGQLGDAEPGEEGRGGNERNGGALVHLPDGSQCGSLAWQGDGLARAAFTAFSHCEQTRRTSLDFLDGPPTSGSVFRSAGLGAPPWTDGFAGSTERSLLAAGLDLRIPAADAGVLDWPRQRIAPRSGPPMGGPSSITSPRSRGSSTRLAFDEELVAVGLLHDAVERGTPERGGAPRRDGRERSPRSSSR